MSVDVFSREQFEALKPDGESVVISIFSPGKKPPKLEGWLATLAVDFHDVTDEACDDGLNPISDMQASAIFNFVTRHAGKNFIVHCDAGISRSVAVGLFIAANFSHELRLHAIGVSSFANSLVHMKLQRLLWKNCYGGKE